MFHSSAGKTRSLKKKMIVGIHGLGNKPPCPILKSWWLESIKEGLSRIGKAHEHIPFEMVYWADLTHEKLLDHRTIDPKDPLYVADPYIKSRLTIPLINPSIKSKLFKTIEAQLDRLFLNDDLSINFKGVADQIIRRYFSDLERYYGDDCVLKKDPDCSLKPAIRNRLLDVLKKYKGYDVLLIAHSMGSIVAFDVLNQHSVQLAIDTFVTIGSPLGLPVIVGRMYADQKVTFPYLKKPKTPDCVWPRWFNLADPEDKVALDSTLKGDYDKNKFGIDAVDITIYNDYEINGKRNSHKSYGYLRTPEMARIIDTFLSRKRVDQKLQKIRKFAGMVRLRTREFIIKHSKR